MKIAQEYRKPCVVCGELTYARWQKTPYCGRKGTCANEPVSAS